MAGIIVFTYNPYLIFLNITIMSKLNLILRLLISLVFVVSVAGCAGSKTHESTGEYFDDSAITTKVKATMLGKAKLKSSNISVETFKGIVLLSGFVDSNEQSTLAAEIARTVRGVKMVNNGLVVK